jgi:hypothetical protein
MGTSASIHGHFIVPQRSGDVGPTNLASTWVFSQITEARPCYSTGISFIIHVNYWTPWREQQSWSLWVLCLWPIILVLRLPFLILKSSSIAITRWYLKQEECILSGRLILLVSTMTSSYLTLTYEDIAIAVQVTLNSLLEDDILEKRYVSGIFLSW